MELRNNKKLPKLKFRAWICVLKFEPNFQIFHLRTSADWLSPICVFVCVCMCVCVCVRWRTGSSYISNIHCIFEPDDVPALLLIGLSLCVFGVVYRRSVTSCTLRGAGRVRGGASSRHCPFSLSLCLSMSRSRSRSLSRSLFLSFSLSLSLSL
jgi:hypothetical protein